MTNQQMRSRVAEAYSGESWKDRVAKMSDGQIIAIYKRLLASGKIK